MVHILTKKFGNPPRLLHEGLAVWFDGTWHGQQFSKVIQKYYNPKKHHNLARKILSDIKFKSLPMILSYNLAGLVTKSLIKQFGINKYIGLYRKCSRTYKFRKNSMIFKKTYNISSENYIEKQLSFFVK